MECTRANFKDIKRVEFFNPESVDFAKPFIIAEPVLRVYTDDTEHSDCEFIGEPAHVALIDDLQAELSIDSQIDVGGMKYKCVLSYKALWIRQASARSRWETQIKKLPQHNYHIRITYISGDMHVIRTCEDGWLVSFQEKDGEFSITVQAENISGAQRISLI